MARITVTVEGEAEDVREALRRLIGGESLRSTTSSAVTSPYPPHGSDVGSTTASEPPAPWTKDEVARSWPYLSLPAQRVLGEIAMRPEGYPLDELAQSLDSNMRVIGGNLASVGHMMRRLYKDGGSFTKPLPLKRDTFKRVYVMEEDVATWIRELAGKTAKSMPDKTGE